VRGRCFWPRQYGRALKGARLVYATQAHLERSPTFLAQLRAWVGAESVLTLIDESNFVGANLEVVVTADELGRFHDALTATAPTSPAALRDHAVWLDRVARLRDATTVDLQAPGWRLPRVAPDWAVRVQRAGRERHGAAFRFPAYKLAGLEDSPVETRLKGDDGALRFGVRPHVDDCLVFTGTTDPVFAAYRLGMELPSPFADHRFIHPDTRWYNLASPIGARCYFPGHAPQVLDLFAGLTARRTAEGRRVLLVTRKRFLDLCAADLAARFEALGVDLEVVTGGFSEARLADPRVVPLITYGATGTNLFEAFDCAYCLNAYYVDESVVDRCLQDVVRPDLRLPIRIETVGDPKRRRAGVADPDHRDYDVARLAQVALEYKEHGVVVQAVGRVRPFTRLREVFTFQMAELPGVTYDAEFRTLDEARRYFEVPGARERRAAERAARIEALTRGGCSRAEVAAALGVTERTVRNYERKEARKISIF
jgi:hypothetical protein